MARIQLSRSVSSSTLRPNVKTVVRTKAAWGDEWRTQRYLFPVSATASVAPSIGSASFYYQYGRIFQNDRSSFRGYDPMELDGHFIQIAVAGGGPMLWAGVVTQEDFSLHGDEAADYSGNQSIHARELGHLLDRHAIAGAKATNLAGETGLLGWTPPVNPRDRAGFGSIGNMSAAAVSNLESAGIGASRIYSDRGVPWTALEYIKYLLAWHHPPGVYMDITGQTSMLEHELERQDVEGLTLWQALEHLIPTRRGVGWRLGIDSAGVVTVHIFSVLGEPVSVGDITIEANAEKVTLSDIASSQVIDVATLKVSQQQLYDRVEVFGERVKVCCTLSFEEETLEEGWTAPEESAYKAGDPSASGSADANDIVRGSDRFKRVYRKFQVPQDWDFKAGSGTGLDADGAAYARRHVVPEILEDGDFDVEGEPHCIRSGKTFLRNLPFQEPRMMYGSEPEFARPMVFVKSGTSTRTVERHILTLNNTVPASTVLPAFIELVGMPIAGQIHSISQAFEAAGPMVETLYEFVSEDYPGHAPDLLPVDLGETPLECAENLKTAIETWNMATVGLWSGSYEEEYYVQTDHLTSGESAIACSLEMHDGEMAFSLKPALNHQLALNAFDSTTEPPTNLEPVVDYSTMLATVAFESDQRLRVRATRAGADEESLRVLTLDANDAELWFVAPGTVTGVVDGALMHQWGVDGRGAIYRDDSPLLRQIAALALAWYGQPRAMLDLSWREITDRIALGSYIEEVADSIGRREIGTIVTEKSWIFGNSPSTSIKTGYAQSGRGGRIDFPGMSGPRALAREIRRMRRDLRDLRGHLSGLPVRIASGGAGGASGGGASIEYLTLNGGAN